ncbi:MFS_PTR2 domain containing protein [Caulobacteraceae bacterium]
MTEQDPAPRARLLARTLFLFASLAGLALAFTPDPPSVLGWDKAEHFAAGAVITLLALPAMPGLATGWLIAGLAVSAALVEVIQATPQIGRTGDPVDWIAGLLGALLAIALWQIARSLRRLIARQAGA